MKYRNTIILFGFITAIMPTSILGFPSMWKTVITVLSGLVVMALAYLAGKEKKETISNQ